MKRAAVPAWLAAAGLVLSGCAQVSGLGERAQIGATPHCSDFFFSVYFAGRSADLTRPAQRVVADAGHHAAGCRIAAVEVVGLSDDQGTAGPNLEISRLRARHVADALMMAGLPAPAFKVSALGQAVALASDGEVKPLRRRADVFIRFMP